MWQANELFILSDLHLAAERGVGLFQADEELADCLRWILTETRDSVIVLAGDMLDFLAPNHENPEPGFNGLGNRTQNIIDHHPEVFEALSELARSPQHRLVILGGDHDPELIFPPVQERVERCFGIRFSNPTVRWIVQGEALRLRVGNAIVLIEHGNVLDPWNRIDHSALQSAFSLASCNLLDGCDYQLPLPPGSRLGLKVMNELRNDYAWIDYLKPETEVALPLLWHFASSTQQTQILNLIDEHFDIKDRAFKGKIDNLGKAERLYKGEKASDHSSKDQVLKAWDADARRQQRLSPGKAEKNDKLIEKLKLISALDSFFEIDLLDDSTLYLQPRFEAGSDLVIHGHTHSAKAYPVAGGFYINTGTWGQLLHLPNSNDSTAVWQRYLDQLGTNEVQSVRRPTFARVQHQEKQNVTTASLLEWQQRSPMTLTARRFSDRQSGWRKE